MGKRLCDTAAATRRTAIRLLLVAACLSHLCTGLVSIARADSPAQRRPDSSGDLSEMNLEQLLDVPIVVAASLRQQTEQQAAASVSIVSAEDISLLGYRNLADILRGQRSFYLHNDGLNWFAGVRGFLRPGEWNARILLLVDGRPTREPIYGQTHLDQDFVVPVEAIKRVEIIRGPGSALYGGNAVFGVINVVTKDGADVNGSQVRIQGGTQGTGRVSATFGTKTRQDWDLLGSLAGYSSRGSDDIAYDGVSDPQHNFGHIRDSDYEGAYAAFFKIRRGDLTATFDFENRQRDNRSATYQTSFFDPGEIEERRANVALRLDHEISQGQSFHAAVFYSHYSYRELDRYDADPETDTPAYRYFSNADEDWFGQQIHYNLQINPQWHLLLGAEATEAPFTRQKDSDDLDGNLLTADRSYYAWAIFAEGELKLNDWLTLVAGGRLDRVQRVGTLLSPRAAAIFTPTRPDTFKLLYGRAFRQPNLYEMFYEVPGYVANPALDPEVADTYELVWQRQWPQGWQTSVDGFWWTMSNAMEGVTLEDDSFQTQNAGDLQARGVEFEVQRRWAGGGSFRAHAAFTRAEDDDGRILIHSPRWIAGASAIVPVSRNTFVAIEPQIVGARTSDLGQRTDPSCITNVVFTARNLGNVSGLELQIGLYNLFADDSRLPHNNSVDHYQPTLNYPQTQFMASLTYRF